MGILSKLFGGGDDEQAQPTDASGTFNDRYQACADCDDIYLCSAHLEEMKTLLEAQAQTTEQPPAPQPRRWLW